MGPRRAAPRSRTPSPTHCPARALGGAGQPSQSPAHPRPRGPGPRPGPAFVSERAGRRRRALFATRPRRELPNGRRGHGAVPGSDHVAAAPAESPRGPEATAQTFLRPGHGRSRRPLVRCATRGTRGGAREGGGRRRTGGRPGTEPGTQRMLEGCAAPPGGWAWSGARAALGLLLAGAPVRTSRNGKIRALR